MKGNVSNLFKMKNNRIIKVLRLAVFCVLAFSIGPLSSAQAATWYVDVNVTGGDGTTWTTAYQTIQAAIDDPTTVADDEIWVKEGTYTLTTQIDVDKAVSLYGGFPDVIADPDWGDRDWETFVTTVDGNNAADHCFYMTVDATIDGFTITGGLANGGGIDDRGAGICVNACSATIANCTVQSNEATTFGGGIFIIDSPSTGTITNCSIALNTALGGGGIYLEHTSTPPAMIIIITNCRFDLNDADSGGAIYNYKTVDSIITNCVFSGNSTKIHGGAIANNGSASTITNCTFSGNHSDDLGGAIFNHYINPTITNCILWGNTASNGGNQIYDNYSSPDVTYCDVQGGYTGTGNIDIDPDFAGAPDYRITAGSPCIDAGDNTALPNDLADLDDDLDTGEEIPYDLDAKLRRFDDLSTTDTGNGTAPIVDMGAYEYIAYTVTFATLGDGSLSDSTTQTITHGSDCAEVTATADTGYSFINWTGNGGFSTTATNPLTITNVTSDMDITANFTTVLNTYNVTFQVNGNGSIDDPTTQVITYDNDTNAVMATADTGYIFVNWTGTGGFTTTTDNPMIATNIINDMAITANFEIITFTIDVTSGANGSISPSGSVSVDYGADQSFTISPNGNFVVEDVLVDNVSVGAVEAYTFTNVTENHTISATFAGDGDSDGISDSEEDGAPNGGDGNNDGTDDSLQNDVTSLLTYDGLNYVTIESTSGTILIDVEAIENPSPSDSPSGIDFNYGFFEFAITGLAPGGSTTVTLYLPAGAAPTTYYKYGPTPADNTDHWYEFMFDSLTNTGAVINGNIITLHFVDGLRGDDDLTANGTIVEPGGPGSASATDDGTGGGGGGGSSGGCFIATTTSGLSHITAVPIIIGFFLMLLLFATGRIVYGERK